MSNQTLNQASSPKPSGMDRFLNFIERAGNKILIRQFYSSGHSLLLGLRPHFYQTFRSTL